MNRKLAWLLAVGCFMVLEACYRYVVIGHQEPIVAKCSWQTDPTNPTKKVLTCETKGLTFRVPDTTGIGVP